MIRRGLGECEIICDGCDEIIYFKETEGWDDVVSFLKEEGWKVMRVTGVFEHYCPTCVEEEDL